MKAKYDLYGVREASLVLAKSYIEEVLRVQLEERDSLYQGGVYFKYRGEGGESFVLKENTDPFEDVPAEQEFRDYKILLYINETARSSKITTLLESCEAFKLLRSEDF